MSANLTSNGAPAIRSRGRCGTEVSFGNFNTSQSEVAMLRGGGFAAWRCQGRKQGRRLSPSDRSRVNSSATHRHDDRSHPVSSLFSRRRPVDSDRAHRLRLLSAPVLMVLAIWVASGFSSGWRSPRSSATCSMAHWRVDWARRRRLATPRHLGGSAHCAGVVCRGDAALAGHDAEEAGFFALVLAALVIPNAWVSPVRRLLGYPRSQPRRPVFSRGDVMLFIGITPILFRVAAFVEWLSRRYIAISSSCRSGRRR